MTIKINETLLCIPPYISTSWDQVATLHVSDETLFVHLIDSCVIAVPNLDSDQIQSIFRFHMQYLELKGEISDLLPSFSFDTDKIQRELIDTSFDSGNIRISIGHLNGLGSTMEHNPDHSHAPDLPKEILHKIGSITRIIVNHDSVELPKAEPNCNCFYCQVVRAMQTETEPEMTVKEINAPISPKWQVEQVESNIFTVTNSSNENEQYSVHLGNPMGCTCGHEGCEHIVAVLRT